MSSDFVKSQKGFIALVTVLIILGIVLMIGLSISFLGVGEAGMSLQKSQSSQSYYLANLCVEEVLMKLKDNLNSPTEGTLAVDDGSCNYRLIGSGNQDREVEATGTFYNHIRKMKIKVNKVNPEIIIDSWSEVAEF